MGTLTVVYVIRRRAQHLFIQCPLGKMVWRIVHMAFGIIPPTTIKICLVIGGGSLKARKGTHLSGCMRFSLDHMEDPE
jgi:hypothetical protein